MTPDPLAPLDRLLDSHAGTLAVPDTWQQGRGAYGGFVAGALIRAFEASAPGRPLRSLTAELCGPLQPGTAAIALEVLRAGTAVTTTTARVVQDGEVLAHGVAVLGRARATDLDQTALRAPALRPWRETPVTPLVPPLGPPFAQHFEFRVTGALPFTGSAGAAEVEGWVRPKRPGARRDAAFLAACIDAYWPAMFTVEPAPRPMATIAFTFQPFDQAAGLDADAPFAYRARMAAVDRGYCVEFRELWAEDGRLLALNQQTCVVIK